MAATLVNASPGAPRKRPKQIRTKSWAEAKEFFAKHLTPISRTPKGWPVYAQKDIDELVEELNVILPEEF
ncbi:MAG TPA: hypothetical protein VKX17_14005 [Planctomycetota bacterium]|nr:hypothetical protein [Planctomycetota bacterium]